MSGQPSGKTDKATKGEKLRSDSKRLKPSVKRIVPGDALTVPVFVSNESKEVAAAGGQVSLQDQESGELYTLVFTRLAPGQVGFQEQQFSTGLPDKVIFLFREEGDPTNYWFEVKVSTSGGFASVDIHLTD